MEVNSPGGAGAQVNACQCQAGSDGRLNEHLRVFVWVEAVQTRAPVAADGHGLILALETHTEVDETCGVYEGVARVGRVFTESARPLEYLLHGRDGKQHNLQHGYSTLLHTQQHNL